ncbi:MAG: response regulator [Campylobacterota bacterium]|nr:response regulator [Campylobacterota bacterium]
MFTKKIIDMLDDKMVLFVDDEKDITDMFYNLFQNGLDIYSDFAYDGKEGLEKFKVHKHDIVISDIKMPRLNGNKMVEEILKIDKDVKVIFISGYKEEFYCESFKNNQNNIVYIDKPISTQKFIIAFEKLFNIENIK